MKKIISVLLAVTLILGLCAFTAAAAEEPPAKPDGESTMTTGEEPPAKPDGEEAGSGEGKGDAPDTASLTNTTHAEPIEFDVPEGVSYLAFTGDQHGETPGYQVWLEDVLLVYGDALELVSYSGDVCDKSWEQETFDGFKEVLDSTVPGRYNVTTGNQEFKKGAPGETWESLGDGFLKTGEVKVAENYVVYDIGATQEDPAFTDEAIEALAAYLDAAPADVPVFVLSHYPLHLAMGTEDHEIPGTDHRQTKNNKALIDVLNQHPNVIFLWGHNHTFQDPRYGTICLPGAKMTYDYDNPTEKVEINFTYANYGSFCRGDSYGLLASVESKDEGTEINLIYIDTNIADEEYDQAVITIGVDGAVSGEVTAGTGIDYDEMLAMSGFSDDPNFMEELR